MCVCVCERGGRGVKVKPKEMVKRRLRKKIIKKTNFDISRVRGGRITYTEGLW